MLRLLTLCSILLMSFVSQAATTDTPPKTLSDAEITRYFVCSYLHTEDSYKIGAYLSNNYEMQWYTYNDKFKPLVNSRLSDISREQGVSKFKAEDELSEKYQCNDAYIDLIGLSKFKI